MLMKNTITIKDAKQVDFDDLIDYVRPIPNKKQIGLFLIKPRLYANFQPIYDTITGELIKDTPFRKWIRSYGEKQVLYDTVNVYYSLKQIQSVLKKNGYFNAVVTPEINYLKNKKVNVNYAIHVNEHYSIKEISYNVAITEYRRIVLQDTVNSLIKVGMGYNEDNIIAERNRIVTNIRNQGYYHVTPAIVTIEVDTSRSKLYPDLKGNPTVSLRILINFDRINDVEMKNKHQYKYTFDKVFIYTNYDPKFEKNILEMDTVVITSQNDYTEPTSYYFITPVYIKKKTGEIVHIKDYRYKTIIESVYSKKGESFSQDAYSRSYKRLRDLKNFSIININFIEDNTQTDSILKKGAINTIYKLTRTKPWGIKPQLEIRTDLTSFSGTYFNRNIFKGAEYLNINAFGSILYYNWWNKILGKEVNENKIYGEYGGSISLDLPRYLFLNNAQKISSLSYKTSLKLGGSYSQLFSRLILYANLSYLWSPNQKITHSFTPIDISTIDSRGTRNNNLITTYPDSYQRKFDKSLLLSLKYGFSYNELKKDKYDFKISAIFESVGLTLTGINYLIDPTEKWKIFESFNYCAFERGDFNIKFSKTLSPKRSIATRLNMGIAVPITQTDVIPFERSFYMGGANSMRGWTFRQLGPGSYQSSNFIERTGDIKMEFNFEYRGTVYKLIKYGLFLDMGNIWLFNEYDNMENAHFDINRFYKEIAMNIGFGLRFDFSYILLRLDYGLPLYNPNYPFSERWINKNWISSGNWKWAQGIQFSINHAF